MNGLINFLNTSYTAYQAVENAAAYLKSNGFEELFESEPWQLLEGGKYFVTRNGGSMIAFRYSKEGAYKVIASHTDPPCLKLKEHAALSDNTFTRLNTEPYGGGLWYTFFDRPLKLAGRIVREEEGKLVSKNYVSEFCVVLPSLAIHQNREANEKFAPNLQTELPLLALGKHDFDEILGGATAYDLFAVPDVAPFASGTCGDLLSSPRIDNLTSVFCSIYSLAFANATNGTLLAACLEAEEIGSRTRGGAGSDFLQTVLERIAQQQGRTLEELARAYASSMLISLDNAHSLHPNHPEKCDLTNRAVMGGGIVIKGHAGGAYTTDGMTSAIVKKIFARAGVKYQTFYNRSDVRSGSTLGAIAIGHVSMMAVDLGLAQLAMHSAVETLAKSDYIELEKALIAFYESKIAVCGDSVTVE